MSWYYLSFADGGRPKGTQFLGGCYVRVPVDAESMASREQLWRTLQESHRLGINPGGEVRALGPIPDEEIAEKVQPVDLRRLLTREEIK